MTIPKIHIGDLTDWYKTSYYHQYPQKPMPTPNQHLPILKALQTHITKTTGHQTTREHLYNWDFTNIKTWTNKTVTLTIKVPYNKQEIEINTVTTRPNSQQHTIYDQNTYTLHYNNPDFFPALTKILKNHFKTLKNQQKLNKIAIKTQTTAPKADTPTSHLKAWLTYYKTTYPQPKPARPTIDKW